MQDAILQALYELTAALRDVATYTSREAFSENAQVRANTTFTLDQYGASIVGKLEVMKKSEADARSIALEVL